MRLGNSTSWARWTKWRLFVPLVTVTLLSILYFGGKEIQIPTGARYMSNGGKISEVDSTSLGGLSSNQEHYSTFKEDGSKQQPLSVSATNEFPFVDFDPHGNDTLVMIHIQKTGGTEFLKHLVNVTRNGEQLCKCLDKKKKSVHMQQKQQKQLRQRKINGRKPRIISLCPRDPLQPNKEQWLISEKTMRWICGLHASYTEFLSCLPTLDSPKFNWNRKLHFAVFLRHPVLRYISEYFHVQRNATWASRHVCRGKPVSLLDMPACYPGYYERVSWPNLTLSGFISCESNWANNRQTLMLASLESVGCFDRNYLSKKDRERIILETAKKNLKSFSFFGITEYMNESCSLFESQFGMKFPRRPSVRNLSNIHSGPILPNLWNHALFNSILDVNYMDVELYKFALDLFSERAELAHIAINKGRVEDELNILRVNPVSVNRRQKFKKLDYNIS